MTKQFVTIVLALALALVQATSKPMDAIAAEQLPAARKIAAKVNHGQNLSVEDTDFLDQCIAGSDPVLTAFAAWVIGATGSKDTSVVLRLKKIDLSKLEAMPQAFVVIALQKISARESGDAWKPSEEQLKNDNPFVRIESTRELLHLNKTDGEVARRRLASDSSPLAKAAADKFISIENPDAEKIAVPLPDERYDLLLTVISRDRAPKE